MAARAQPLGRAGVLGLLAAALVAAVTLGALAAVLWRAEGWGRMGPSDWSALRFTLWQALLSAGLSVALAVPVARALARRSFPGRGVLITLLGAPFLLPVIVAILGLVAIFGRAGLANQGLGALGLPPIQIYGLQGVVLAHVFFNLPLATRLILQGWARIPAEQFRLAASLGFTARDTARLIEAPMLRAVLPGAFMVIFLLCTTSFAVALALGGGPRATTLELAIYQAFRFEFDLPKAATLATVQMAVTASAAILALRLTRRAITAPGLDRPVQRFDSFGRGALWADGVLIGLAALFLLLPLAAVLTRGVPHLPDLPVEVVAAALRSILVALVATALSMGMALVLALTLVRLRRALVIEAIGYLAIATSPLVIGTGLFVILNPLVDPAALALPVTAVVNAVIALPFALRVMVPALREIEASHGRLADSLGMAGWARLRWMILPRLRRPMGFAAGLTAALSMGDLGVVALFADPQGATLPLQLYRLMAAYRMDEAAAAACLLLALSLALFWAFDRGGRGDAEA